MNKKCVAVALALGAAMPVGQALADTKAAVQFENIACIQNPSSSPNATGRLSIMTTNLSTSNATSFIVDASLVTGLWTSTSVRSGGPGASSGSATGAVEVGVVMDGTFDQNGIWNGYGTVAYPGFVTFDARTQTLTATLGQALTGCTIVSGIVQCTNLSDQAIDLMLDTTSAHSFKFILPNVGVTPNNRPHRIDVVAKVSSTTLSTNLGSALASACYGAGSLSVEAVRLGRSFACSSTGCSTQ
jgi:hypothetical protein